MATTNAGAFSIGRVSVQIDAAGTARLALAYQQTSCGHQVSMRELRVFADGSAILDQSGKVIANSVPAVLANAISTFLAQLDTLIGNGAAAGKLDL